MDMRSCEEMRQDAWKILTGSNWGWKILLNGIVLYAILIAVVIGLKYVFETEGIQTWESFREAQREAKQSGVDLAIASGHEAMRMTLASGILAFVKYLFLGIVAFGMVTTLLKCIKGESRGWFSGAFGGFARPFEMLSLTILMIFKVFLWSLFLIIPGIIACLRYALAWYVKAENPDMSANDCIKRSCELMYGRKWKLFFFWLSYIGWYILLIAPLAIASGVTGALSAAGAGASEDATAAAADESYSVVMIGALVVTILIGVFVVLYTAIGQAVFYRDAKAEVDATKEADPSEGVTA